MVMHIYDTNNHILTLNMLFRVKFPREDPD
jgi:hypothetical protein